MMDMPSVHNGLSGELVREVMLIIVARSRKLWAIHILHTSVQAHEDLEVLSGQQPKIVQCDGSRGMRTLDAMPYNDAVQGINCMPLVYLAKLTLYMYRIDLD